MVYTAIFAVVWKPLERYAAHSLSFVSPAKTNSVENERITPE